MNIGKKVYTPRFCTVTIEKIFTCQMEAADAGYQTSAMYDSKEWEIVGKSIDCYTMEFAAYPKSIIVTPEYWAYHLSAVV